MNTNEYKNKHLFRVAAKNRVKRYLLSYLHVFPSGKYIIDRLYNEAMSRKNGEAVLGDCLVNAKLVSRYAYMDWPEQYTRGLVDGLVNSRTPREWVIENIMLPEGVIAFLDEPELLWKYADKHPGMDTVLNKLGVASDGC